MRLSVARITPLKLSEATDEQRAFLQPYENTPAGVLNIYRTTARNIDAARSLHGWGAYVLRRAKFDNRLRELLILRIGWLCRSGYEWTQHARRAQREGMAEETVARIKQGAQAAGWSEIERLVLQAADELHTTMFVSEPTWTRLRQVLSEEELMNLVFIVGHYTQVCMILNTFGVQLEEGQVLNEDFRT